VMTSYDYNIKQKFKLDDYVRCVSFMASIPDGTIGKVRSLDTAYVGVEYSIDWGGLQRTVSARVYKGHLETLSPEESIRLRLEE